MQKEEIDELFERYKRGECNDQERDFIDRWYLNWHPESLDLSAHDIQDDLAAVRQRLSLEKSVRFRYKLSVAALFLLTVGLAFYFYTSRGVRQSATEELANKEVILPGSNKALLTLANGKTIVLDNEVKGNIGEESGIQITKSADGELVYQVKGVVNDKEPIYNTISTPKGGQYQVLLPDGTKVWLNAASNLRFPVVFTARERKVELSGEAYFEVTKDVTRPFKVKTSTQEVEVLGTHFNVNAYVDENFTKTTLLEGKVKVSNGREQAFLTPGQQALNLKNAVLTVKNVKDVAEVMAWKNGLFVFDNEDIHVIMNKISRWYDVDVEYQADMRGKSYSGNISRFKEVNEVLNTMELTETIHFKIEGKKIIVTQ